MQKIFISYSRKDMEFVRKLAGDMEKAGYDIWWDITDLRGGDDWVRSLPAAIEASQFFIIVLTPNSIKSEWVQKEYTQALTLHKKIIPLMFEVCDIPFALNTINYVNFLNEEYADNFKNLLSALGYTGKPPVVTPFERAQSILPPAFRKYTIPGIIGIILLILLAVVFTQKPITPPDITSTPAPIITLTDVSSTFTATIPVTVTASSTPTATEAVTPTKQASPTPTLTPSATKQPFETLNYCVNSLYANTINVRSGPGTSYAVLGEPLKLRQCLAFRAVNEIETWLLIAPNQEDAAHQQYEGGWIFRELLGLGLSGPIDLPAVTMTFTPTPSDTPTPSNTPTITPSPTLTPTETATDTPEPTNTLGP
jgi:SH3-like domain-containing protein